MALLLAELESALLAAVERAASGRLRAAEAELGCALRRNAELEDKARQAGAECQAWMSVAQSHEAVTAGLRGTLEQLLLRPPAWPRPWARTQPCCFKASCCFKAPTVDAASRAVSSGRSCGRGEVSVCCSRARGGTILHPVCWRLNFFAYAM